MADAITVQKGHIATYNMHVYPGEIPTGVWASLMAQNLGHIKGNFTCHMESSPMYDIDVIGGFSGWALANSFDLPWPPLGSYARIGYYFYVSAGAGEADFVHGLYVWVVGETDPIFEKLVYTPNMDVGEATRVTFEWTMIEAGLDQYFDDEKVRVNVWSARQDGQLWEARVNEWLFCVANRPF
jgi:hypothetical protein